MGLARICNLAWMLSCVPEARRFGRAMLDVGAAQASLLAQLLRDNRDTEFGRRHGFAQITSPAEYQRRVPPSVHADYSELLQRIAGGEANVLTREPVDVLQPTSGTTGGEKLIPLTAGLRRQFHRAVAAWMYDLLRNRPALRRGRAYWSISPAVADRRTAGGIPIGFDDDADYLGGIGRLLLRSLLAVPSEVARVGSADAFRYCTLWFLLRAADLSLVSVWSPTFLSSLLENLELWGERLCSDIRRGEAIPVPGGPSCFAGRRDPRRAEELAGILRSSTPLGGKLRQIWPGLSLISCWADAGASVYLPQLRQLFPSVEFQPKGLLATEGCVSFPLLGRDGAALAIRSHFLEFQELEDSARLRLAHELDVGGRYRVVITTGGGLYRYQLRDVVEVRGHAGQCPLVRFVGKSDSTSDMVGEKLAESFVRSAVEGQCTNLSLSPSFVLLVPISGSPAHYRLYIQSPGLRDGVLLATALDLALRSNPHYAWARDIGQLAAVDVAVLDPRGEFGWSIYERRKLGMGMRAGNIKPMLLDPAPDWAQWLDPHCLAVGRDDRQTAAADTQTP